MDYSDPRNAAYRATGGPGALQGVGVVVSHGFTGTPASIRGWADGLAAHGAAVCVPQLPGHVATWQQMALTNWQDWYRSVEADYDWLAERCRLVVAAGLSMGGALATLLSAREKVAATLLVNPSLGSFETIYRLAPVLARLVPSVRGVGGDVKNPDPNNLEQCYARVPLKSVVQLTKLWARVQAAMADLHAPVLLFKSREDHVVDDFSLELLDAQAPALQIVWLENSYHVATLDADLDVIVEESVSFLADLIDQASPPRDGDAGE